MNKRERQELINFIMGWIVFIGMIYYLFSLKKTLP